MKGSPSTNHSSSEKTRMNDFSCGVRMWAQISFVLLHSMRLTDRQTNRRTYRRTYRRT